jgi:hypothetical protein
VRWPFTVGVTLGSPRATNGTIKMYNPSSVRSSVRLTIVLLWTASAPFTLGFQERRSSEPGYVISGRVVDPHQLRPEDAVLMLGRRDQEGFSSQPIPLGADGAFVTLALSPTTYVLELVRTPHSPTKAATVVGFTLVPLAASDVTGVTVEARRDTALTGRFRMVTDNPRAVWPPHIVVNAYLALDGMPLLNGTVAEGAPAGRFVLRNAFGPRVLRCGYTLAAGDRWWPSQVILDGVDITNAPTDFSAHENGDLEVVFTQHPARVTGTVMDAQGQPVRAPWILVSAADAALSQQWATTSEVTQGNTIGEFSIPVIPGRYLVSAVGQTTFHSYQAARREILRYASSGVPVEVKAREIKDVRITLQGP